MVSKQLVDTTFHKTYSRVISKTTTTVKKTIPKASSGSTRGGLKVKLSASATNSMPPHPAVKTRKKVSAASTGNKVSVDVRGVRMSAATDKFAVATKTRAKTLRLAPQYENALGFLKAVLGASVNKMVNDAVGEYIERETARVEVNLGDLLTQVKAYRKADPDFNYAHARVVEAEMKAIGKDPADGTLYTETPVTTRRRSHA